ncbi:hypothetical protein CQW23_09619 [Capsicum baccatum]|uniref:Uncharacterized protein n=1 Tax=Capsicum baccatum TaxID=33114 RepID=A0A2G2WXC4_CAPBA|nr:hypothetical protein CQW23_09619 [Capsicum baccatum]
MGLVPRVKGPLLLRAMRMTKKWFIKAFISCHPEDVALELMECYRSVKRVRSIILMEFTGIYIITAVVSFERRDCSIDFHISAFGRSSKSVKKITELA